MKRTTLFHYCMLLVALTVGPSLFGLTCRPVTIQLFSETSKLGRVANRLTTELVTRLYSMRRLQDAYIKANADPAPGDFFTKFLNQLEISIDVRPSDAEKIPATGSALIAADHSFGFVDGAAAMSLVKRRRTDVKVLMFDLMTVEGIKDDIIPIRLLGNKEHRKQALEEARKWLAEGHCLVIFPAGQVASYRKETRSVAEWPWRPGAARLALATQSVVIPMHIPGSNSYSFQALRRVSKLVSAIRFPAETLRLRGQAIPIYVGDPIAAKDLPPTEDQATAYIFQKYANLKKEVEGRE